MTEPFTVVALIAAYNEEDIIEACLDHLRAQGIDSYLLDDGSTDGTFERARAYVGRGLIGIERLPQTMPATFSLDRIMSRKEELASSLPASWFINHDADEFRDSLWSELDLRQAMERVDRMGWNAIDFEIFTIRPVGDPATARADPGVPPVWYSPGADYDRLQVRAWKRTVPVDLRTTAGHDVAFEGKSVFPLRFPMRHYPVRSQAQGARKVFLERLPRFDAIERDRGWHVQYDRYHRDECLVAAPSEVLPYDPVEARIRSALHNRDLETAQARLGRREQELSGAIEHVRAENAQLQQELAAAIDQARIENAELAHQNAELAHQLAGAVEQARGAEARLTQEIRVRDAAAARLTADVERIQADRDAVRDQLALVYRSRSWRWMSPLRVVFRLLGGR